MKPGRESFFVVVVIPSLSNLRRPFLSVLTNVIVVLSLSLAPMRVGRRSLVDNTTIGRTIVKVDREG